MCVYVYATGFISLLQIDGGGASHPIIWPGQSVQGKKDHRRGRERDFTLSHLMEIELNECECVRGFLCVRMSICVGRKEADLHQTAIVQS